MEDSGIDDWCNHFLPELYDEGMFDSEEADAEVWNAVTQLIEETTLPLDSDEATDGLVDALHAAAEAWFRFHHACVIDALPPVGPETITALTTQTQVDQHSAEWYTQRRNRLTASEFGQILTGRRGTLLLSKVDPAAARDFVQTSIVALSQPDGEMPATYWGHRFEPIVRQIYEEEISGRGSVCDTLGRFTHKSIPWLSASPDGLVTRGALAGRLLEIKAPKTRQPGQFVPDDYYAQMQIQMEVCDLDAVDFVEAQFIQRHTGATDESEPEPNAEWKGRIEIYGDAADVATWVYRYSSPANDLEDATWLTPPPPGLSLLESSVWWLVGWYPRTVLRNERWWSQVGSVEAARFWNEVEEGRKTMVLSGGWRGS